MIIKYISIILGTTFEIYCINKFINIFSPRKEINKNSRYKYYLLFILISVFRILIPLFFNGILIAIGLLISAFLFNQLYESKQYVKMIISISLSAMYISSELLFGGIFMLVSGNKHMEVNTSPEAYAIGTLLTKFFVFVIILIFETKKKSIVISNLTPTYLTLLSVLPITTITLSILMYQIILVIDSSGIKLTFVFANMLLILSNAITFEIIRIQNRLAKSEYDLNLLKNNVNEQTKHYEELKSSQEEIRQIRHNIRSIYIGTLAELKVGKIENAIEELQSNIDIIEKSSIIAIGKIIADSLESPKPLDDIKVIFVESNSDLEFFGFVGDNIGTIDTEGNLIHIGDSVKMFCKDGHTSRQFALKILPKQKSINFFNGKVVKSYKKLQKKNGSWKQGIFHFVSCLEEYQKSINQPNTEKEI